MFGIDHEHRGGELRYERCRIAFGFEQPLEPRVDVRLQDARHIEEHGTKERDHDLDEGSPRTDEVWQQRPKVDGHRRQVPVWREVDVFVYRSDAQATCRVSAISRASKELPPMLAQKLAEPSNHPRIGEMARQAGSRGQSLVERRDHLVEVGLDRRCVPPKERFACLVEPYELSSQRELVVVEAKGAWERYERGASGPGLRDGIGCGPVEERRRLTRAREQRITAAQQIAVQREPGVEEDDLDEGPELIEQLPRREGLSCGSLGESAEVPAEGPEVVLRLQLDLMMDATDAQSLQSVVEVVRATEQLLEVASLRGFQSAHALRVGEHARKDRESREVVVQIVDEPVGNFGRGWSQRRETCSITVGEVEERKPPCSRSIVQADALRELLHFAVPLVGG